MNNIIYNYNDKVYFNITNCCPCSCDFCIRNTTDGIGGNDSLWLDYEPDFDEIKAAIDAYDFTGCSEIIYCGFGEPTCALENLKKISAYIRSISDIKIRLNTNGLSDLIHGRSTAREISEIVDSVSISLNMPDAEQYEKIVHPQFGLKSFDAVVAFAKEIHKYMDEVKFSVVDVIGPENVEKSRAVAEAAGIPLRVREYTSE